MTLKPAQGQNSVSTTAILEEMSVQQYQDTIFLIYSAIVLVQGQTKIVMDLQG